MRPNRNAVVAAVGATALLAGGGAALAGQDGTDRGARCEKRLERIADRRGVSVAELEAKIDARLLARVDAALQAGRISTERAAKLRQRISDSRLCDGVRAGKAWKVGNMRLASHHGMLRAAAEFLGLDRAALKAQLPGTSLASLAQKQGKSVGDLEAAMLAPAKERLAGAVAAGRITQGRADRVLEHLERLANRLVERTFPAKS